MMAASPGNKIGRVFSYAWSFICRKTAFTSASRRCVDAAKRAAPQGRHETGQASSDDVAIILFCLWRLST
jgi:hypothetical protein